MKKITDYAELVKAKHALNKTIAPVEDGANIAGSYTSGKQFIREGVLYTALTTIAANTAWSSLTLDTDYELADDLTSQLASLNQTLTQTIAELSHRNLLDNPFFTVNQRGNNSYSSGYGFDRWVASAISKSDDVITFTASANYTFVGQKLEKNILEDGEKYTFSILKSDGAIISTTFTYDASTTTWQYFKTWGIDHFYSEYKNEENDIYFHVLATSTAAESFSFKAVKLEKGTVSTLALDTAPNYQQELAKCQRYFQKLDGGLDYVTLGMGGATSATSININVPLCVPMRVNPSVKITADGIIFIGNSQFLMDSTFTVIGDAYTPTSKKVAITAPNVAMTQNALYYVDLNKTSNKPVIELSADL